MSTVFIDFKPSKKSNFQFLANLDGTNYNCVIRWNLFSQRYYLDVYTNRRSLVIAIPFVGSPNEYDISLTAGYFDTKIVYRYPSQQIEVIT